MSRLRRSRVASHGSRRGRPVAHVLVLLGLGLGLGLASGRARAQEPAATDPNARAPRFLIALASERSHPVPLDLARTPILLRRIAVDLDGVSLKQALAEVAAHSGLALVYGDGVLPVERRVHLRAEQITVVAALTDLLADAGVDVLFNASGGATIVRRQVAGYGVLDGAVLGRVTDKKTGAGIAGATVVIERTSHSATTGNDGRYRIAEVAPGTYTVRARYIGYAPAAGSVTVSADQETTVDLALEKSVQRLDEVVTTGTVVSTEVKALPTPITVISADQIAEKNIRHVDELFRGDVPGVFAWNLGGNDYTSAFASIRGSTVLGPDSPAFKVYVDGIEMADELFLSNLDPASVERVEIVRGPQASTLYGSQALNGVIQIFTKRGATGLPRPQVDAKAAAGLVESQFANAAVDQDYSLEVNGGSARASYHLGGTYRRIGQYVAGYGDEYGGASGGARIVNGPLTADFSARYQTRTVDVAVNPLYPAGYPVQYPAVKGPQEMYATTVTYRLTPQWEHAVVAGLDRQGYDYYSLRPARTTPDDTLNNILSQVENRVSLGYHTTLTARLSQAVSTTWTAGVDHWAYSSNDFYVSPTPSVTGNLVIPPGAFVSLDRISYSNTGYFGQLQAGLHDAVFLTAGLRAERNPNVGVDVGTIWAPRVGLSAVKQLGEVGAKVRASYGKAIRPPGFGYSQGSVSPGYIQLANPSLKQEEQVGFDTGLELYFGRRASLEVTYYNQRARDLIDREQIAFDPATFAGTYQYVNLGRVKNTGWEFQGSVTLLPPVTLTGTFSLTTSTIDSLGPGYAGNYQLGDRVLGVPRTSGGATLTYAAPHTTISAGMTYVGSWVATDVARQLTDFFVNNIFTNPIASYWINYPAFARFRVSLSQQLTPQLNAFALVENVTNRQTGELNNLTITPGRLTMIGLRLKY